jgi:glycosyltransferase involved in cell wall biosynthesis
MPILSVVIPVYNEEKTVAGIIQRVFAAEVLGWGKEVIVVDDGSTDATASEISMTDKQNLKIISHQKNLGKGAAVRTGIKEATGDAVIIQDADLEYDPNDYQKLLEELARGEKVVYGSRNLGNASRGNFFFFWGGKFLTRVFNLLFGTRLTDVNTGYKLFRLDALKSLRLESSGFEFCEEVTAKTIKAGFRIKEVAISYAPRKFSEGKKICARDGLVGLATILKCRFS